MSFARYGPGRGAVGVEAAPLLGSSFGQEVAHRGSLVRESPDVALRFRQGEGSRQGANGPLLLSSLATRARLAAPGSL